MSFKINFQEPPPPKLDYKPGSDIEAALQARPGEWAYIGSYKSSSTPTRIRQRNSDIEATARTRSDHLFDVYARWRVDAPTPRANPQAVPDLVFRDPPPNSTRGNKWGDVIDGLKQNPGKWALVGVFDTGSRAAYARQLGLEVTQRRTPEGVAIYARWPADDSKG